MNEYLILDYLYDRAIQLLSTTDRKYFVVAAALDRRGRVLSVGQNVQKTHPIMAHYSKVMDIPFKDYLHAEIHALIKAGNAKPYSLVVARVNKQADWCLAKPCPICQQALKDYGVKRVYYTDSKGDLVLLRN